jgi:hypothetical protein
MAEILQVLPLRECENYFLKCHKKKDAQREKERLSKNEKRQMETQEESAQCRKINCECMKSKQLFEILFETQEESTQRKKTDCEHKVKQRQTETEDQGAERKKTM